MLYFKVILASFLMSFVAIYGLIAYGKGLEDPVNYPHGHLTLICAAVTIVLCGIAFQHL